jgi:hypothetical protein
MNKKIDLVDMIMQYEEGTLDADGTLVLYAELIKTGKAWQLQGSYGRAAVALIDNGWIDEDGNILKRSDDE